MADSIKQTCRFGFSTNKIFYLALVCCVICLIVEPPLPIIAPTISLCTSMRNGNSVCLFPIAGVAPGAPYATCLGLMALRFLLSIAGSTLIWQPSTSKPGKLANALLEKEKPHYYCNNTYITNRTTELNNRRRSGFFFSTAALHY